MKPKLMPSTHQNVGGHRTLSSNRHLTFLPKSAAFGPAAASDPSSGLIRGIPGICASLKLSHCGQNNLIELQRGRQIFRNVICYVGKLMLCPSENQTHSEGTGRRCSSFSISSFQITLGSCNSVESLFRFFRVWYLGPCPCLS